MQLIIASTNWHKVREFREILKSVPCWDVLSLLDFPDFKLETPAGKSFEENAVLKAESAAKALQRWVLADDSGIIVPSLQGAPGICSRYYAGDEASEAENRKKLLEVMRDKSGPDRAAHMECCIAIASPEGLQKVVTGSCEGEIVEEERGRHGFGYDPLFRKYDYDKTFAELDESVKVRISDRRKAFEKLAIYLESVQR